MARSTGSGDALFCRFYERCPVEKLVLNVTNGPIRPWDSSRISKGADSQLLVVITLSYLRRYIL